MILLNIIRRALPALLLAAGIIAAGTAAARQPAEASPRRADTQRNAPRSTVGDGTWRTEPRHDLSLKVGAFPFTLTNGHLGLGGGNGTAWFYPGIFATPDAMQFVKVRRSPRTTAGGLTLAYTYRVTQALAVGVAFTYTGLYGDVTDARNGRRIATDNVTTLSAAPMLRLQWLNRPIVRCYSALAIGPAVDMRSIDDSSEAYIGLSGTIVGVSVGRRLYGFAEVGAGMQGIFSAGIGYRF